MPKEIPGFYYDEEKNRYFPLKGPIPGSSSTSSSRPKKAVRKTIPAANLTQKRAVKISKLLQSREMYGNVLPFRKGKFNFQEEMAKIQASRPVVMKYGGTSKIGDGALQQITVNVNRIGGQTEADILLAGGVNGSLSLLEVGRVGQDDHSVTCMPNSVWPRMNKTPVADVPMPLCMPAGAILHMPSSVSCIKAFRKDSNCQDNDCSRNLKAMITTLGSDLSGGYVYMLDLSEPLEFGTDISILTRRLVEVASFNCTVWTADCCSNGSQLVAGTNMGASLVNLETGLQSWICRSKSDVLATQIDQSGNVVICGLRNGAVVTIDVREKWKTFSGRPKIVGSSAKRLKLSGLIESSQTVYLPSSISSLLSLQAYDQYFLASSMDGSIKLYDHRLTQKGAVQSYEGHVNSHTRIELGVDPYERFLMSGGEDCFLRLWSIKSGKLIFEEKFSDSVISKTCWKRSEKCMRVWDANQSHREYQHSGWEAWLGSCEGLYCVNWLQV